VQANAASDIDRRPDEVFDLMADVRNETEWNSQVTRAELTSGLPIALDSHFLTVNRGQEYTATITEYDKPHHLVFDVAGTPMHITATFDFRASGEGTHLDAEFDMQPQGVMKLMLPLMAPMVRRDFPKQLASFKSFCESRSGAPDPPSS
jgi:hypothetical protein